MSRTITPRNASRFITLLSVFLVVSGLYFAREFLIPLALAVLFSFLLAPIVRRLEKFRLPRVVAVLMAVLIGFSLVAGVAAIVYQQMSELSPAVPKYRETIKTKLSAMRSGDGIFSEVKKAVEQGKAMLTAPTTAPATQSTAQGDNPVKVAVVNQAPPSATDTSPLEWLESFGGKILGPIGTIIIVIVFSIFMLLQREDLRDRLIRLLGSGRLTVTTEALDDISVRVSKYLLMQTLVNASVGCAVTIGLWSIGKWNHTPFPSPALWGLLTALLRFIPYVGIWLSAVLPFLLAIAAFSSTKVALEAIVVYVVIELIAANALEPMLFGASTGISTLSVLVAAAFWAWLWGGVGLLLSTPLTVCLVVIGKYVPQLKFLNILLGDEPALDPPARVYQRLLSANKEDAIELLNEYEKKMPIEQIFDEILLPALSLAERDWRQDELDDERHAKILKSIREISDEFTDREREKLQKEKNEEQVKVAKGEHGAVVASGQPLADALSAPNSPNVRVRLPKGCAVNVVTLPAHDEGDEIAAVMLNQLLELNGYCTVTIPVDQLASEMVQSTQKAEADVVVISSLPPAAVSNARYLRKRVSGELPELNIVVGIWTDTTDLKQAGQTVGASDTVRLATTLRQAMETIHQIAQPKIATATVG